MIDALRKYCAALEGAEACAGAASRGCVVRVPLEGDEEGATCELSVEAVDAFKLPSNGEEVRAHACVWLCVCVRVCVCACVRVNARADVRAHAQVRARSRALAHEALSGERSCGAATCDGSVSRPHS